MSSSHLSPIAVIATLISVSVLAYFAQCFSVSTSSILSLSLGFNYFFESTVLVSTSCSQVLQLNMIWWKFANMLSLSLDIETLKLSSQFLSWVKTFSISVYWSVSTLKHWKLTWYLNEWGWDIYLKLWSLKKQSADGLAVLCVHQ